VSDTERRFGEKAWDIALKIIAVLLMAISGHLFYRLDQQDDRLRTLETKAAVIDTEKNTIMVTLGEIKADLREIKAQIKKGP
jgi:hypothetical protein